MDFRPNFAVPPSELSRTLLKDSENAAANKVRFYNIAQGSLEQCRYYLILAKDLEYGDVSDFDSTAGRGQ